MLVRYYSPYHESHGWTQRGNAGTFAKNAHEILENFPLYAKRHLHVRRVTLSPCFERASRISSV